jgi:hypothetical protein
MSDKPASIYSSVQRRVEREIWAVVPRAMPQDRSLVQSAAFCLMSARQMAAYFARKGGTKYRGRPRPARSMYLSTRRLFLKWTDILGIDEQAARDMLGPVEPHKR